MAKPNEIYVQSAKLTTHYLFELQFDVNYLLFHVLPIVLRAIQVVSDCSELRNKKKRQIIDKTNCLPINELVLPPFFSGAF